MRLARMAVAVTTAAVALVVAAPSSAKDAPFPMNPFPADELGYAFNLQTLFGHGSKVKPTIYCADSSVFRRGYQIVFRTYVVQSKTSKVMTGKDFSRMVLRVAGQPDKVMTFRPQGGQPNATSPWLWSTAWVVPDDYPLGTFKFDIAAKIKATGKWIVYNPVIPGTEWQITP